MSGRFALRSTMVTDQGLVRENNEDSAYAGARLVAIADGVGGEVAGEVASGLAIAALTPLDDGVPADPVAALRSAVATADVEIRTAVTADPALAGMGTTLTALLLGRDRIGLAHVGDSRAYRLRAGALRQLTRDDTYVQHLVEQGRLSAEEARVDPRRSVVTRILRGAGAEASYSEQPAAAGDRYLLCSDGLSDYVEPGLIAGVLRDEPDRERCAARLIDLALAEGAPDNVTAVVTDVVGTSEPAEGARIAHPALLIVVLLAGVLGVVLVGYAAG